MEQVESNRGFTALSKAACVGAADFATGFAAAGAAGFAGAVAGAVAGLAGAVAGVSAATTYPTAHAAIRKMQTLRRMKGFLNRPTLLLCRGIDNGRRKNATCARRSAPATDARCPASTTAEIRHSRHRLGGHQLCVHRHNLILLRRIGNQITMLSTRARRELRLAVVQHRDGAGIGKFEVAVIGMNRSSTPA